MTSSSLPMIVLTSKSGFSPAPRSKAQRASAGQSKAYWVMMMPRIAQIAQRFGSDDIDGTLVEERIYHDAGATTSQNLRRAS